MKHIIVGASGLIGNALYRVLKNSNEQTIGTYNANSESDFIQFDITKEEFGEFIDMIKSDDVVYLLSAYSNPSWIYNNKLAAEKLNFISTCKFIEALKRKNPRIIFMSSVEVFDGTKGNYAEFDEPNPLNYYGRMKHAVEKYLSDNYPNHTIIRTGWNIGLDIKSRCVVKLTYESLLQPEAKMASDNKFSISSALDTATGLYTVSKLQNIQEMHICSDHAITRTGLASLICKYSNRRDKMGFSECLFSDISYTEPRGKINDLNNTLSKNLLGIKYKNIEEIILEKISFLDANE